MSPPSTSASTRRLTRRAVLAAVVGAAVAGCTGEAGPGDRTSGKSPGRFPGRSPGTARATEDLDPDVALAGLALADEQAALRAVEATLARHPDLAQTLAPLADAHRAHIAVLADAAPDLATDGDSSAASAGTPTDTPGPRVPRQPQRAMLRLAVLEEELSTSVRRHAFVARSGAFARLLASIAASAAQNAAVAAQAAPPGRGRS